ncbi:MAG: glycosyltransferase family 4 protein [Pseudomonadota bacterium]|nr:glycosyltransferase family 4 protein [Pseudomonadota bacterium]
MKKETDLITSPAGDATKPPTILQVLPSLETGGVERGTIDITGALKGAGWRPLVASSGGAMAHELERSGADHFEMPLHSKNPHVMRRNIARLRTLIESEGVDIVHARSRAPAHSAIVAARQANVRFITTFHATYNFATPPKRWYNSVMAKGERVIAISNALKDHVLQNYIVNPNRIRVIHRGIDLERFDPARVSAERVIHLSREWRLPDGVHVVLLPGRLTGWKGQSVLIEALAQLGHKQIRCLLVGSDQGRDGYRRSLEELVRRLDVEDVVHIVGECRDMPAAYMLADVVVSASTDPEGFGRVMVEAQAMGRPIIASDHGASREIVRHGNTGWLFPPGDVRMLSERIAHTIRLDEEHRHRIAGEAILNARDNFDRLSMCTATLNVYRELLSESVATARYGGRPVAA